MKLTLGTNPTFHQPIVYISLGTVFFLLGILCFLTFPIHSHSSRDLTVTIFCVIGILCAASGSCMWCTRREMLQKNWVESKRKQSVYCETYEYPKNPVLQPIISGYDPVREQIGQSHSSSSAQVEEPSASRAAAIS